MIGTSEGRLLSVEEGRNYLNWLETAFVIYLSWPAVRSAG